MKDTGKTYSIFDLIEDKEVLTHASSKEASEFLNATQQVIYKYSHNKLNFRRRYRITRHEDIKSSDDEWERDFSFKWEQICNFLNPKRKGLQINSDEQKK